MAINKKLVHFKKKATFESELAANNILGTSIVFIQDANEIWTHGTFYPCPYTKGQLDTKFTEIDNKFKDVAEGSLRGIEIYTGTTAPTESNYILWVNDEDVLKYRNPNYDASVEGSIEWLSLNVLTDPNDGKYYVRRNKQWVPLPSEIHRGTTEPTGDEVLWLNPETGELKYKNEEGVWELIGGGIESVTETVKIKLSSNLTQPDANLNGTVITISYSGSSKTETWNGEVITLNIPMNTEYTISVATIEGYSKPADATYTAMASSTRELNFVYNTTRVRINYTILGGTASSTPTASVKIGSGTAESYNLPATVYVPTGSTYTVTFGNISGFKTPTSQTRTAEGTNQSILGIWQATSLRVIRASNHDEVLTATATVACNGTTKTINFTDTVNDGYVSIPYNSSYTISFSNVAGYKTPTTISGTANSTSITKTGTYQSEFATISVTGQDGTPSGYTITVKQGDTVLGTQTTNSKLYKIPFGVTYTVEASNIDGFTTPAVLTFVAGNNNRTITVTYVYNTTTDLSMMDIHGNALSSRSTANCYVVREPGTYKFPLVYGNAIKNGSTNSKAYTRVSGSYTADFVDGIGNKITDPYISNANAIPVLSVCDTDGVFADLSIVEGTPCKFIQFTVKKVPHTGANGIISLQQDMIFNWSWHIWVWEDDLTPKTITNSSGNNYDILPVNLGSKYDEDAKTHIKNWFYQWGRSTPLICPSAYNSTTKATNYGEETVSVADSASNVATAISSPATFYKYSSSYNNNWVSLSYFYNYWDANCTTEGANDNKVIKTVYDPCPVGYCVGNANVFTGFSTSNVIGSFNAGYKFKANSSDTTGIFFPASGYLNFSSGNLSYVGSYGYVWSSALRSLYDVYGLTFSSGGVNPLGISNRAYGFSVRPVREL